MSTGKLADLISAVEACGAHDPGLWSRVRATIEGAFPGAAPKNASVDAALSTIDAALPSWALHIQGHSAGLDDRWTATIRETGVRDDDELIGVGKSRDLACALLAALLKVIELRDVVV